MGMRISVALLLLAGLAMPAAAQVNGPKKYAVTTDQALVVTKDVLVKQGYEVVRVENRGRDYVVVPPRQQGAGQGQGSAGENGDPPGHGSRGVPRDPERRAGGYRREVEALRNAPHGPARTDTRYCPPLPPP